MRELRLALSAGSGRLEGHCQSPLDRRRAIVNELTLMYARGEKMRMASVEKVGRPALSMSAKGKGQE